MINSARFKKITLYKIINQDIYKEILISKEGYELFHPHLKTKFIVPKYIVLNDKIFKYNKDYLNKSGSLGIICVFTNIDDFKDHRAVKIQLLDLKTNIPDYENIIKNEINFYTNLSTLKDYPDFIIPVDILFCSTFVKQEFVYIVMKYVETTLDDLVQTFIPKTKVKIVNQLCNLVLKFKKLGYVHNDLKPKNILCEYLESSNKYKLYLIDFNCYSKNIGENLYGGHTLVYGSPQVLLKHDDCYRLYSNDIWSLGIIIFKIFNGLKTSNYLKPVKKEYLDRNLYSVLMNFVISKGNTEIDIIKCKQIPEIIPEVYINIIKGCFKFCSKSRISIETIVDLINNDLTVKTI